MTAHQPTAQPGHETARESHRARTDLERRVHVDLPRVRPEDMMTTQEVDPAPDPRGGRNPERDFMLRYGAGL